MSWSRSLSAADQIIDDVLYDAQRALDVGEGLMALYAIPGLAYVPSTLSDVIGMVLKTRGNENTRIDLAKQILALANVVKSTLELADSKVSSRDGEQNGVRANSKYIVSPELEKRVYTLNQKLESLKTEAEKLDGGSFLTMYFGSNSNADILSSLKAGVEEATNHFKVQGQVTIEMLVHDIAEAITATHDKIKMAHHDDVNEKALKDLPFVNASYSSSSNPTVSGVLEGTRTDLLHVLEQWTDRPDPESGYDPLIYVLSGGVGTGKSTIAYSLAKKLDDHSKLAASFFFVHNATKLNTARHFLPTIAYQLARNNPEIYPHIAAAAATYAKKGKHDQQLEPDFEDLIIKPLKNVPSSHPRLTIVIDALDECTKSAQDNVVQLLYLFMRRIPEIPFPLRVLITTRPELHIQDALNSVEFRNVAKQFKLQDIPTVIVDEDIMLFFSKKIEALSCWGKIYNARPTVIEDLTRLAGGLFVYAAIVVNCLKLDPHHAVETLDALLSDNSTDSASNLWQLDQLYLIVLQRAFVDVFQRLPHFKEWTQTVLGSIAVLEDHVSTTVLCEITGARTDDARSVLDRVGSVILLPEDQNNEVRVLHASFPQFLVDHKRCTDSSFYIDASVHHGRLAVDCLKVMTTTPLLVENICRLEDMLLLGRSDIPDLQDRINKFIPKHLRYACMHWATHLSKSKTTPEIMKLMEKFTSTKLLAWVEVLVYLNQLDIAVIASGKARKWLLENDTSTKTHDNMAAVPDLMNDVNRLVLQFFSLIDKCTGHIYHHALPFSPSCKLVALYSSMNTPGHVHRMTHMTSPRTPTWGPLLRIIETGSDRVNCAAFSPDGLLLASCSNLVQIWDASTGMLKKTMIAGAYVDCLAWAPDGKHIVSCSEDKSARVWNIASGAQAHKQDIQERGYKVAWNPTGTQIIVAGKKLTHVLTITPGKGIEVTKVIEIENVQGISKDANHAISTPQEERLCVWDIGNDNFIELQVPEGWSCDESDCVEFLDNDTKVIAYSSQDETVGVWDWKTGETIHEFRHKYSRSLTVSPHGDLVAIEGSARGISIWEPRTRDLPDVLTDAMTIPRSISSDNERLVSTMFGYIQVWDLAQRAPQPPPTIPSFDSRISFMVFSTDGSRIAAARYDRVSILSQSGLQLCELPTTAKCPPSFSPNTQMLAVCTHEGVQIWHLRSTRLLQNFSSVKGDTLAWSPNGRWLAVHTPNGPHHIEVFDAKTGTLAKGLKAYDTWHKSSLEFSHDSTTLYFKSGGNELTFRWEEGTCVDTEEHRWNTDVESSSGYSLDHNGWVTRRMDGRRMCLLPMSRRHIFDVGAKASWGDYYAVGSDTGDITTLYFAMDSGRAAVDTN